MIIPSPLAQKYKKKERKNAGIIHSNDQGSSCRKRYPRPDDKENSSNAEFQPPTASVTASSSIPHSLLEALAKYEKQFQNLSYDHLPLELCRGRDELNLSVWTMVIQNSCLDGIVKLYESNQKGFLRALNLRGGERFSDSGLKRIAAICPNLISLNLENCFQIRDGGLKGIVNSCPKLQELDLSGCMGISGPGFAVIGDYNPKLISLKVSGCRQITPWTFMKLFEGCRELVELDVSYCSKLTDREIKILSDHCSKIERLDVRDCCQVSDVGVLSLSQGCCLLSDLSLSRSDMPFKVTDVALMALGQGCPKLSSISLRGCASITDAGLSWLCKGCSSLERIDLANCSKITNGGVRYIGEECHELKTIVLTNLKQVSDVGLRYLAEGCHQLESLTAAGMYLLSDGIRRDFGFEGLQSMSKSKCTHQIKYLNLHGCFQIHNVALAAIGRFSRLESLTLSSCTKIAADGIAKLAASCCQVKELSLANCGDCISDGNMELLAGSMKHLITLNLCNCKKIGRKSFAALSGCKSLQKLDASGCIGITDDAVMSLCSGRFSPGLESLDLSHCPKVGDISLSYIADGLQLDGSFEVTLTKLALKGTCVKPSTLKAIRDQFRYASIRKNNGFFGFWPLTRPLDRKIINEYGLRTEKATLIQAKFRARQDTQTVQRAREAYCRKKVATLLAALWRGHQARLLAQALRNNLWARNKMAIKVQCWARIGFAKTKRDELRHCRWLSVAPFAAITVQRIFRGWLGRKLAIATKVDLLALLDKMNSASRILQAFGRMVIAKQGLCRLIEMKACMDRERLLAAKSIQNGWRQMIARSVLLFRRMARDAVAVRREWAAMTIQSCHRKHKFRVSIAMRVDMTRLRMIKAALIQKWIRRRYVVIKQKALQALLYEESCIRSAVKIQCLSRQYLACAVVERLRQQRRRWRELCQDKALVLTKWWRVCMAQNRLWELKRLRQDKLCREIKVQHWAATIIAAGWRGKCGRDKASRAKIAKMERWKAMWSKEQSRPFYYNQVSGEMRWRKPQALLDLEPRPTCSNCSYYEAQIECADCMEYFCHQCWTAVHFGGKRAQHRFRALYDFYGRRIEEDVWGEERQDKDL